MGKMHEFIGFPEGLLGEKPMRLPLLANESDWFALEKPAGLLGQAHPWHQGRGDITGAIRFQISNGKAELERLGIRSCHYVCGPELEIPGPVLFAKNKNTVALLKNALGSDQFVFKYYLLSESDSVATHLSCELPVAPHKEKALALVSHRFGKKSSTSFIRLNAHGKLSLWEALTNLPRMDQVRLHAAEVGIPVLGDNLYGLSQEPDTGESGRNQGRRPRFSGLAMYLGEMNLMSVPAAGVVLKVSPSKQLSVFCRKCVIELAE